MNNDTHNLILAIAMSVLILISYQVFLAPQPDPVTRQAGTDTLLETQDTANDTGAPSTTTTDSTDTASAAATDIATAAASNAPRAAIANSHIEGSLSLAGGRLDDISLSDYGLTAADDPERVHLLRRGSSDGYFAEVLFLDADGRRLIPKDTIWQASSDTLSPETPLTIRHNRDGVDYEIGYRIDDDYLVTITATAKNNSAAPVAMRQFARILRSRPSTSEFFISYEGPLGVFAEDTKTEIDYDDIEDFGTAGSAPHIAEGVNGWAGITDKYWLVAFIPASDNNNNAAPADDVVATANAAADARFTFRRATGPETDAGVPTQVDIDTPLGTLGSGDEITRRFHLYAGPKKVNILLGYSESLDTERLDHAIDWGWFPFLTKPFFHALNFFYGWLGNFGLAILALTVIVKLVFFPLANKSYHSMAKMRTLAPKMQELRTRFGDDRQRQQQEMMALYRSEGVNPAAGCLPILLQIPVFFALYKVLFVTIEMRHAPFYGWITDLSALDPTSIINLFGLLPFSVAGLPDIINLGVWPILMGVTMFIQMSLNPPPPDPVQARIFKLMPVFFTFLLATFPAGLVIYWTWNNLLSIVQQMFIMRSVKKAEAAR